MKHLKIALSLSCIAFALSACSGAKETLGLNRSSPDEFSVVRRAPLAMPKGLALPPPVPGAQRPQEDTVQEAAQKAIFGHKLESNTHHSTSAESLLLQKAGSDLAQEDIRDTVDAEMEEYDRNKTPVVDRILNVVKKDSTPASIVNAKEEAERIKRNKTEGKPITEGETPTLID